MTKAKWTLIALLMIALAATVINRTLASNHQQDDQQQLHQQHQHQASADLPPLIADGAKEPSAIPDLIAYEMLFNSVVNGANATEPERLRAEGLANKTGLAADKVELLKVSAQAYRTTLAPIDAQAKNLKDQYWPKPDQWVLDQLSSLQKQKDALLSARFNSLLEQLSKEDREKLNNRVLEIKRSIKGYQDIPVQGYQRR